MRFNAAAYKDRRFAALGDLVVEQLDDIVAPREQRVDLLLRQSRAHRFCQPCGSECPHPFAERALTPLQQLWLQQIRAQPERPRVIDHPHRPVVGPQEIAGVAVAVLNELVEDAQDVNIACRARRVGSDRHRLHLLPVAFLHRHVIEPPGDRRRLAVDGAQDRHRDVVETQQQGEPIGGNVVAIGVLEIDLRVLGPHVEERFRNVDVLDLASCVRRPSDSVHDASARDAFEGPLGGDNRCPQQEGLHLLRRENRSAS